MGQRWLSHTSSQHMLQKHVYVTAQSQVAPVASVIIHAAAENPADQVAGQAGDEADRGGGADVLSVF